MDAFFTWVEAWRFGVWLREEPSLWVFPFILVLHTVGLAFMVGANVAVDARALGLARGIPLMSLSRYFRVMWAGFWVNAFSGVLLLIAYPKKALTNPLFYVKLLLLAVGIVLANAIRRQMAAGAVAAGVMAPARLRLLAGVSLACWAFTITAGRLLAYTCSRLMVDSPC